MPIRGKHMDYESAKHYWEEKDKANKAMPKEELEAWLDHFLASHNTLSLATATEGYIDNTPLEYNYFDKTIYIFTEGGHKFIGLEKNKNVCIAIYEPYVGFQNIQSVQLYGTCEVIEPVTEEYKRVVGYKRIPYESAVKMNLHLLKMRISKTQILSTDFKKLGYPNRQSIEY